MTKIKRVVFRFELVRRNKAIDNKGCLAVGFLNLGGNQARINGILPIPDFNPASPIQPFYLPVNEGERDATRYNIVFQNVALQTKQVLVIYKEAMLDDYVDLKEANK